MIKTQENSPILCIENSETQQLDYVDSSKLHCRNSAITEPCTLHPGYTWRIFRAGQRLFLVHSGDNLSWRYIILDDNEDKKKKFLAQAKMGVVDLADYGQVLKSGWGKDPPSKVAIVKEYFISENR